MIIDNMIHRGSSYEDDAKNAVNNIDDILKHGYGKSDEYKKWLSFLHMTVYFRRMETRIHSWRKEISPKYVNYLQDNDKCIICNDSIINGIHGDDKLWRKDVGHLPYHHDDNRNN